MKESLEGRRPDINPKEELLARVMASLLQRNLLRDGMLADMNGYMEIYEARCLASWIVVAWDPNYVEITEGEDGSAEIMLKWNRVGASWGEHTEVDVSFVVDADGSVVEFRHPLMF